MTRKKIQQATNPGGKITAKTQNHHQHHRAHPTTPVLFEGPSWGIEKWETPDNKRKRQHKGAPNELHGGPNFDNQTARSTETRRSSMPLTFVADAEITTLLPTIVRTCMRTLSSIGGGNGAPRQPVRVGVFEVESAVAGSRSSTRQGRPGIRATKCSDPWWLRRQA